MALISCPECSREISDRAGACPHCGCPLQAPAPTNDKIEVQVVTAPQPKTSIIAKVARGIFVSIAIVAALGFGILMGVRYLNGGQGGSDDSAQDDSQPQQKPYVQRSAYRPRPTLVRRQTWRRIARAMPRIRLVRNQTLDNNKSYTLGKNRKLSLSYTFKRRATLSVRVVESFGKNIKFEILQDGRVIFRSGRRRGSASGMARVRPGLVSVVIHNGNWLRKKHIYYTVKATY